MVNLSRVKVSTPKVITLGILSFTLIAGAFFFSSCQNQTQTGQRFTSAGGVSIEGLLPADTFLLAKFGSSDQVQLDNLKQLNALFPNDPLGEIAKGVRQGYDSVPELESLELDYEKDLKPILNEKSEIYFAVASPKENSESALSAVLAVTLGDMNKLDALFQTQLSRGKLVKAQIDGQDYFTEANTEGQKSSIYMTRIEDVFFLTTDQETMRNGLDNYKNKLNALAGNEVYQKAIADYMPSIAYLYGDFGYLLDFIKQSGEDGEAALESLNAAALGEGWIDAVESETISLMAEKEGFRFVAMVKTKDGSVFPKLEEQSAPAYLMKKIPATYPVLYLEGYNLAASYESFEQIAGTEPELADGLKKMREFFAGAGMDFEKDILSFLGKGYAFVLEDTDSMIPALGMYIDASGNPEGAAKAAAGLDQFMTAVWGQMTAESPEMEMIMKKEEVTTGKLWKFALNLDPLLVGQSQNLVKKLSGQKIELYYGLLSDNTLALALKPDLEKVYGQSSSVADSGEFKAAMSYVKGDSHKMMFASPAQLFSYLDRIVELAKAEGASASDFVEYQTAREYIRPLKSLISVSGGLKNNQVIAEAYLHVAR